jgi:hypothetical protein
LKNRPIRNPKKLNRSPNEIVVQKKKTNAFEEPKFRTAQPGIPEGKESGQKARLMKVLKISQYLIDEHRTEVEMLHYKRRIETKGSASLSFGEGMRVRS